MKTSGPRQLLRVERDHRGKAGERRRNLRHGDHVERLDHGAARGQLFDFGHDGGFQRGRIGLEALKLPQTLDAVEWVDVPRLLAERLRGDATHHHVVAERDETACCDHHQYADGEGERGEVQSLRRAAQIVAQQPPHPAGESSQYRPVDRA